MERANQKALDKRLRDKQRWLDFIHGKKKKLHPNQRTLDELP